PTRRPRRHITPHHTSAADDRTVAHRNSWQHNRAAANPHSTADPHRPPELQACEPALYIARVVGCINLHRGPNLRAVPDVDRSHIQQHAVEVHKHSAPYENV